MEELWNQINGLLEEGGVESPVFFVPLTVPVAVEVNPAGDTFVSRLRGVFGGKDSGELIGVYPRDGNDSDAPLRLRVTVNGTERDISPADVQIGETEKGLLLEHLPEDITRFCMTTGVETGRYTNDRLYRTALEGHPALSADLKEAVRKGTFLDREETAVLRDRLDAVLDDYADGKIYGLMTRPEMHHLIITKRDLNFDPDPTDHFSYSPLRSSGWETISLENYVKEKVRLTAKTPSDVDEIVLATSGHIYGSVSGMVHVSEGLITFDRDGRDLGFDLGPQGRSIVMLETAMERLDGLAASYVESLERIQEQMNGRSQWEAVKDEVTEAAAGFYKSVQAEKNDLASAVDILSGKEEDHESLLKKLTDLEQSMKKESIAFDIVSRVRSYIEEGFTADPDRFFHDVDDLIGSIPRTGAVEVPEMRRVRELSMDEFMGLCQGKEDTVREQLQLTGRYEGALPGEGDEPVLAAVSPKDPGTVMLVPSEDVLESMKARYGQYSVSRNGCEYTFTEKELQEMAYGQTVDKRALFKTEGHLRHRHNVWHYETFGYDVKTDSIVPVTKYEDALKSSLDEKERLSVRVSIEESRERSEREGESKGAKIR